MSLQESLALVQQQIQILFIFLARPIVQRQLVALAVILLTAWALPYAARRWLRHRPDSGDAEEQPQASPSKPEGSPATATAGGGAAESPPWYSRISGDGWFERYYLVFAPIIALTLNALAVYFLRRSGTSYGILQASQGMLWAWLAYRLLLALLYARYGDKVHPYQNWVLLPLFLWLVMARVLDSFVSTRLLSDIPLFTVMDTTVTVGSLSSAIVVLYWFIVASWLVQVSIRSTLSAKSSVEPGVIESVVTVSRYVVILTGVLIALNYLGVDLSTLAIIGGGLSIGVGFGLQNIVASFISGLVLLFEQSLLPGDVIDINGDIGTVERVNMRSTTVRTIDNVEVVVPNDVFLSTEVTTFTKTDNDIRVLVPFGVSYDSDPHEVRAVVLKVAGTHPLVIRDPEPILLFGGYGESSLNFELAVWIDQPELARRVSSDLYYLLWDAFAEADINIPFPQRDLNMGRGWGEVLAT